MSARRGVVQVLEQLEAALSDGRYLVGSRLPPERELAAQMQVSRACLREAMVTLGERGWIERRQGDGTYVRDPGRSADAIQSGMIGLWRQLIDSHGDLQVDLIEFRSMLETRTAELAAVRHTREDIDRLQLTWAAVDKAYGGNDRNEQIRTDVAFHHAIADATHNPIFVYLIRSLLQLLHDHVRLSLAGLGADTPTAQMLRQQHRRLLDAILARDSAAARRSAGEHIRFVAEHLNALERR